MTQTKTPKLTEAEILALTNAYRIAANARKELADQHSDVRGMKIKVNTKTFLVREYPGRYRNGCERGSRRLISAAQTLDDIQKNITQLLDGKLPAASTVTVDLGGTEPEAWTRGRAFASVDQIRRELNLFDGHFQRADASRGQVQKINDELATVKAKGVDTVTKNVALALSHVDSFKLNFTDLHTHASKVVDAFKAWDDAGRTGKLGTTLPPLAVKVNPKGKKGTTPKGSVGNPTNHPATDKNGVPKTDKKSTSKADSKKQNTPGGTNGDGRQHTSNTSTKNTVGRGPDGLKAQKSVAEVGLQYALGQLAKGVSEVGSSNTGTDVNKYLKSTGLGGGYPWCAAFVRWCMEKAGFTFPKGTSWAACEQFQAEAARKGTMFKVGHGDARPGDLIVWGGRHIGIVESLKGGTIHYVAGNQSDAVRRGTSAVSDGSYTIIRLRQQ